MNHVLLFDDPAFEDYDLQSTCRLGRKWFDRLGPGDEVRLEETGGGQIGTAEITGVSICPFGRIPVGWASRHHLPEVHTTFDLAEVMKDIYGEDFGRTKPCTMILFRPDLSR